MSRLYIRIVVREWLTINVRSFKHFCGGGFHRLFNSILLYEVRNIMLCLCVYTSCSGDC